MRGFTIPCGIRGRGGVGPPPVTLALGGPELRRDEESNEEGADDPGVVEMEGCCCGGELLLLLHPHFSISSPRKKATCHPVSLMILSMICRTSSCACLFVKHSAAIARQRRETLATPLLLERGKGFRCK